jgi:5S rRNA maturation endonuclease (ribonuclease M5)
MNVTIITIKEYLTQKGIEFRENNNELITKCLFGDCDKDSRDNEAHLYFDSGTGQYNCKKCGSSGNLITLQKHLGETPTAIPSPITVRRKLGFDSLQVLKCHAAITDSIRKYLNSRGITDEIISKYKIGYGKFYKQWWITIPVTDKDGNYIFFKLRQDPTVGNEKITYPKGIEAQIYGWETLQGAPDQLVICEGELDRLLLLSKGINAITSTHGAGTFKQDWVKDVQKSKEIFICFDNDDAGKNGALRIAKMLDKADHKSIYVVGLPDIESVGKGADITDYFITHKGEVTDLLGKYAKIFPERIDTSKFKPMSLDQVKDVLGLTIKKDDENKIVTFLALLSAYTDNAQFNISFNAPSSSGKSFIPLEISNLFPEDDVMKLAHITPTAFLS